MRFLDLEQNPIFQNPLQDSVNLLSITRYTIHNGSLTAKIDIHTGRVKKMKLAETWCKIVAFLWKSPVWYFFQYFFELFFLVLQWPEKSVKLFSLKIKKVYIICFTSSWCDKLISLSPLCDRLIYPWTRCLSLEERSFQKSSIFSSFVYCKRFEYCTAQRNSTSGRI